MDTPDSLNIETRQKAELIFQSPSKPLVGGAVLESDVRLVQGYSEVLFLILSDQPFQLRVEEAISPDGPWTSTLSSTSSVDMSSGVQKISERLAPSGLYMRIFVDNLGGDQTFLDVSGVGLPISGGTGNSSGTGSTGLGGPTGPAGAIGPAGAGTTGLQGPTGVQGVTGIQGQTGIRGITGLQGITGLLGTPVYIFTSPDVLTTSDNDLIAWLPGRGNTFSNFLCFVKTAPTGADITIDFRQGTIATGTLGAVIATVTIPAGSFSGSASIAPVTIPATDFLAMEITQVGSTIAGANLTGAAS